MLHYAPDDVSENNPIQQVVFRKLYIPNSVLQRKIKDLEQSLSKQKVEFRKKEKEFEIKFANLKSKSSSSTSSQSSPISMNCSSLPDHFHESPSISEQEFDAYMNSETDDDPQSVFLFDDSYNVKDVTCLNESMCFESAPKCASSFFSTKQQVSEKLSKKKSRRSRKRKASSTMTTSKEQKVNSFHLPSKTNLSSTFHTGLNNGVQKVWRQKALNVSSKESSTEPVSQRSLLKKTPLLSKVSKLCYSIKDLMVCNNSNYLDNIVFVNDLSIKPLLNVSNSMTGCVTSVYSPALIHKYVPKNVCFKGPIFKWVPKRT